MFQLFACYTSQQTVDTRPPDNIFPGAVLALTSATHGWRREDEATRPAFHAHYVV